MPRKPNFTTPLPNCEGPKLHPFKHRYAKVDFHHLLGDSDSVTGGHAHVFEVSIKSVVYALKIFKFYDDEDARGNLIPEDRKRVTTDLLHAHMDPFYNECRAYGRLIDAKLNGKLAVHCHGYMTLPAAMEDELQRRFMITTWDRPTDDQEKPVSKREPLRAIVKNLVRENAAFEKKDIKKMLVNLKRLLKLGIYPLDVNSRNYRGGILLDFSIAITEPHYLFETRPKWQVDRYKREDLLLFDRMIEDANINTQVRAMPNDMYRERLRRA